MNHLAISCFITFVTSLLSAIFVILHSPKTILKKIWGLFNFFVSFWAIGIFQATITPYKDIALFWFRASNLAALFIPISFFHFVLLLTNQIPNKKPKLIVYYFVTLFYFFVSFFLPNTFIPNVAPKLSFNFYLEAGSLYFLFPLIYIYIVLESFVILLKDYKTASKTKRNQFKYLFFGILVGHLGGFTTFPLVFNIPVYPFGAYLVPVYILTTSYAIVKHQLMDIRIVFKKSIIYSISIATISILYLLSIFTLEKLAQEIFGYHSLAISIGTAFALGLFFIPIRHKIQYFMDKYFFRGTPSEIAEQNEQLRQEIVQSEKYKTLTTLTTGFAHEIKNPLTAIKTFSEFLPQKLEDKKFLKKFARIVSHEVERIDDMIHQLLDYGKPAPLAIKKTNIHKLLNDTLEVLSNTFISKNITVVKQLFPASYSLNIDPNQIRQALLNILLNAVDAMPQGGTLTISTSVTNTSYFVIEIEDTGKGIRREDLSQIFDPFFSRKDSGTGLGLSITQSLITNHKGVIQIRSKVRVGTTVRIDLPC